MRRDRYARAYSDPNREQCATVGEAVAQALAAGRRMRQGSGAPSICWQCLRQLQRAPGEGLGLFYFNLVRDRAGVEHRVHGEPCTRDAVNDGNVLVNE